MSSQNPQGKNFFKSENIVKVNDRLGAKKEDKLKRIDLRAVSRDDF